MAKIQRFEDLQVWKTARTLINKIYDLSDEGRFSRDFALRDQIRRAAISIGANIAEGFESASDTNFARFLSYSKASAAELRALLYIAFDRKYLSEADFHKAMDLAQSCGKQLTGFIRYLQSNSNTHRIREDRVEYELPSDF